MIIVEGGQARKWAPPARGNVKSELYTDQNMRIIGRVKRVPRSTLFINTHSPTKSNYYDTKQIS